MKWNDIIIMNKKQKQKKQKQILKINWKKVY